MRAKKSLGQHFLTSKAALGAIIRAADLSEGDTVLEIGPGKGVLTEALLQTAKHVIAIEADRDLVALLQEKFAREITERRLTLVSGDALAFDPLLYGLEARSYKLVANIPYYITGAIIRTFLTAETYPKTMVLLIQKEVAERIVARNGKESLLSLSVKAYGTPKYIEKVPARSFSPAPKVDSAILQIADISKSFFHNKEEERRFFALIKAGFAQKRKQLRGNLTGAGYPMHNTQTAFKKCGFSRAVRAEDLSLSAWLCFARNLANTRTAT